MLVPNTALTFLRSSFPWLDLFLNNLHRASPRLDMDHVIAFCLLGASAALALPRLGWRWALVALLAIATLTEVAQFWVPGRHPRVSDALADVAGGLLGYALVCALVCALRRVLQRRERWGR